MIRAGAWRFALGREGEVLRLHRLESRVVGGKVSDHMMERADKSGTVQEVAAYLHGIDPRVSVEGYITRVEEDLDE